MRREAGLPQLDEIAPDRSIKSPFKNPAFTRHAEEDIFNQVDNKIKDLGLTNKDLDGKTLSIHVGNSRGVCNKCAYGLFKDVKNPGVLKQFSDRYPNLKVKITAEGGSAVNNIETLIMKNGKVLAE